MVALRFPRKLRRSGGGPTGSRTLPSLLLAFVLLAALFLLCPQSALAHPPPYHDYLAPHGSWTQVRTYGWVWLPRVAVASWRPYTVGHWEYTDFGWTWFSDEPWGDVVFHYGRWVYLPSIGWAWVPGTLWGPAWVTWRWGVDYLGWAPLPPEAYWADDYIVCPPSLLPPPAWIFVESRFLGHRHLHRHVLEPRHNHDIVARTKYLTRFIHRGGRHIRNLGPPHERFDRLRARRHRSERIGEAAFDFGPRAHRSRARAAAPPAQTRNRREIDARKGHHRGTMREPLRPPLDARPREGRAERRRGTLSVVRGLRSRAPVSAPEVGRALSSVGHSEHEPLPSSQRDASRGWRRHSAPSQGILHNKRGVTGPPGGFRATDASPRRQSTSASGPGRAEDTLSVVRSLRSRAPVSALAPGRALPSVGRSDGEPLPSSGREAGRGWRRQRAPSQGILHNKGGVTGPSGAVRAGLGRTERATAPFAAHTGRPLGAARRGRPSFTGPRVQAGPAIRSPRALGRQGFRKAR